MPTQLIQLHVRGGRSTVHTVIDGVPPLTRNFSRACCWLDDTQCAHAGRITTRSQAIARIADRTAQQQTTY